MLNTGIIVGKIIEISNPLTMQNGDKMIKVIIEVPRAFKNSRGLWDSDEIECILWKTLGEAVVHHAKVGSTIAVKGRIQVRRWEDEEKNINRFMEFIAEKVNFISKID